MIVHAFEDPAQATVLDDIAAVLTPGAGVVDQARGKRLAALTALIRVDQSVMPVRAELLPALRDERDQVAARVALARTALQGRGGGAPPALGAAVGAAAGGLATALVIADRLFAVGLFFEVHEVLEPVWQRVGGERRRFVQGLLQLAVGLHHLAHARPGSAATLLAAARDKLERPPPRNAGVDPVRLLAALAPWERHARAGRSAWPEALAMPELLAAG